MRLPIILLFVAVLAGCSEAPEEPEPTVPAGFAEDAPQLEGWVLDEAVRPIPGARITTLGEADATTTADDNGRFVFEGLPTGEVLVFAADAPGFETATKSLTLHPDLPSRLNFTMARVPVKIPYHDVLPFTGFLACQFSVVVTDELAAEDCGGDGQSTDTFVLEPAVDFAGAVIEIAWTPGTPLAASLYASVGPVGGPPVTELVGGSILRLQVAEQIAQTQFASGEPLEVHVRVLPNTDEVEAAIGAGLAISQDFEVFASLFYVEPPEPTYTIA